MSDLHDREAHDFQNVTASCSFKDISSLVKISLRSDQYFYVKLVTDETDRQTDRQTNAGYYRTSLA